MEEPGSGLMWKFRTKSFDIANRMQKMLKKARDDRGLFFFATLL